MHRTLRFTAQRTTRLVTARRWNSEKPEPLTSTHAVIAGVAVAGLAAYMARQYSVDGGATTEDWIALGDGGGGEVNGTQYSARQCFEKSLHIKGRSSHAWEQLALLGGGTVNGKYFDPKLCIARGLDWNPHDPQLWFKFGKRGGGVIPGTTFYGIGIKHDECGGVISGRSFDPKHCYQRAAELDPTFADAWEEFGNVGGGTMNDGIRYRTHECYSKARALREEQK
jgi:hypothetical protein